MHTKIIFNFSNLFIPLFLCLFFKGTWRETFWKGFSPRFFYFLERVLSKVFLFFGKGSLQEYFVNTAYKNYFQLFKFIYSIYFMFVFLRDMERNFLYKTMNNGLYKTMNNGLYKTMNNGFGIIRTDNPDIYFSHY